MALGITFHLNKASRKDDKKIEAIDKLLDDLSLEVAIGLFEDDKEKDGKSVLDVGKLQEFGGVGSGWINPETKEKKFGRVPPRPFMRPAIEANEQSLISRIKRDIRRTFKDVSNKTDAKEMAKGWGKKMTRAIRKSILAVNEPPLSKITLRLRKERGNDSKKPLVDTGKMLRSVKYEIRELKK